MNLPNRRSFFTKLFLAAGAVTLFPRLSKSAPIVGSGTLTGTTTIPAGSTLVAAPGSTLNVTGATLVGFPASGTTPGPGTEVPADILARLDALTPRFAIFEIPLGIDAGGNSFSDFELKGSETNFQGSPDVCYFYGSQYGGADSTHGQTGVTWDVFFTDDLAKSNHNAARPWRTQNMTQSIFEQKYSAASRIGGAVVVVPMGAILNPKIRPDNPLLKFVYQRVTPQTMEECWVPILPKWVRYAPTPAVPLTSGGGFSVGSGESAALIAGYTFPDGVQDVYITITINAVAPEQWFSIGGLPNYANWFQGNGTFCIRVHRPSSSITSTDTFFVQSFWTNSSTRPTVSNFRLGTYPGGADLLNNWVWL